MFTDGVVGLLGMVAGLLLGFGWNSLLILMAAFAIDGDILLNEFFRIFVEKEKRFSVSNFLDEYSYTHKYVLHLPLMVVPTVFMVGTLYANNYLFGLLVSLMVLCHLVHDTIDDNFDGVCWGWPFSDGVYKFKRGRWEIKSRDELKKEAKRKAEKSRDSGDILKDNSIF